MKNLETLKFPIGAFQKPISISENDIQKWIETIENFPNRIKRITENLSVEKLNWQYRPEGWSIKQVVHHCGDSHMNSLIRFKLALTEDLPTIRPYEEALWAILPDGVMDELTASIQIIQGVHARWVLLLKSFSTTEFTRQFLHPASGKIYTLDEALGLYAWHCNHHLAHIEQALLYKGIFPN
ncbi:YfiT family bacillithiol transferase [Flavobacterium sp.]|uniref:YfiT family bacillithiol transferase n=1 Tax=Flavobacterium sp. TaxID=239 RepID=UPI00286DEAF7|nr:putative metal-dependent hydrolase [Flavobacterium sp.]